MAITDPALFQNGSCYRRTSGNRVITMNASSGGAGPLPIITGLTAAIPIVNTTVSTLSNRNPLILLTFSGIIGIPQGTTISLNFEVIRSMENNSIKIGPTYTVSGTYSVLTSQSTSFQIIDNNLQYGNYTYTVQLSQNSTITGAAGLTITNAVLSALVSESTY